jgi:hypothetical protein
MKISGWEGGFSPFGVGNEIKTLWNDVFRVGTQGIGVQHRSYIVGKVANHWPLGMPRTGYSEPYTSIPREGLPWLIDALQPLPGFHRLRCHSQHWPVCARLPH